LVEWVKDKIKAWVCSLGGKGREKLRKSEREKGGREQQGQSEKKRREVE